MNWHVHQEVGQFLTVCQSHPLAAAPWNKEGTNLPGSVLLRSSLSLTVEAGSLPGAKNMPRSTGQERCLSWCFLGQSTQPWFQAPHKLWLPFYKTFETWLCGLCFLADQPLPTRPPPTEISTAELVINAAWQLITQPSSLWIALGDRLMHWEVPCSLSHCTHSSCKRAICHLLSSTRSNLPVWAKSPVWGGQVTASCVPPLAFHFTLGNYRDLNNCLRQTDRDNPAATWPVISEHVQQGLASSQVAGLGAEPVSGQADSVPGTWVRSLLCWPTALQVSQEGGSDSPPRVKPTPRASEKPPQLTRKTTKKRPFWTILFYQKTLCSRKSMAGDCRWSLPSC